MNAHHLRRDTNNVALLERQLRFFNRREQIILRRHNFAEFVCWKQGYTVIGTSGASATSYRSVTYPRPAVLLMGSERQGLSQEQQTMCDVVVSIPMVGRSDSLNLAVATGVMLYELFHQSAASTHTRLV